MVGSYHVAYAKGPGINVVAINENLARRYGGFRRDAQIDSENPGDVLSVEAKGQVSLDEILNSTQVQRIKDGLGVAVLTDDEYGVPVLFVELGRVDARGASQGGGHQ